MNPNDLVPMGNMHMAWPNQPMGSASQYATKEDAWIARLLEANRALLERMEELEQRLAVVERLIAIDDDGKSPH